MGRWVSVVAIGLIAVSTSLGAVPRSHRGGLNVFKVSHWPELASPRRAPDAPGNQLRHKVYVRILYLGNDPRMRRTLNGLRFLPAPAGIRMVPHTYRIGAGGVAYTARIENHTGEPFTFSPHWFQNLPVEIERHIPTLVIPPARNRAAR